MTKYIYATKNVKSGNFNQPMLYDFPKENAGETFEVSFKETPKQGLEAVKELDVYFLGTFDTKKGTYETCDPEFILSGSAVLGD